MLRFEQTVFGQGKFELSADFSVNEGLVTAVLGPSGAGKSTLLAGIAGFVEQRQGRLMWQGEDLRPVAPHARPVSMLFQDHNLFPHLTVEQNIALALAPRLRPTAVHLEQVETALQHVGLVGLGRRKPSALSGGQQSRVALARVLLQDRPVLLLDEPFGALGPALKAEMLDLTLSLAGGRTVVMISHDPSDAARIADRVIGVADGVAFPPVEAQTFLSDPPKLLRAYFGPL